MQKGDVRDARGERWRGRWGSKVKGEREKTRRKQVRVSERREEEE